ncbi:MAG: cell division protein FtsL [Atopobiaceae bacterium]|jgi:cell division protein FtsL
MRYQSQEAYELFATEPWREQNQADSHSPFVVVEGGHLDADVRRGVSPVVITRVKLIVAAAIVLFVLGCIRVSLSVATVNLMQQNQVLKDDIAQVQAANMDLDVERSLLSSKDRIARIATQNLGMVYSTQDETLTLD